MANNEYEVIGPTRAGKDLEDMDKTRDAHILIKTYKVVDTNVYVDLFDWVVENHNGAHVTSEIFP
jgi:hypothetical protein